MFKKRKQRKGQRRGKGLKGRRQCDWLAVHLGGDEPNPRYGHTLLRHPSVEFSNEVFILDWRAKEWKMIQEGSDGGGDSDEGKKAPLRRNFHTAVFHHNPNSGECEMVIFAGKSNGYHNDLWKYVLESDRWEEIKPTNVPLPARRYGHTAVVKGSDMFVYGGFDSDSSYCIDLWAFSFGDNTWTRISTKKFPPARFQHSAVMADDTMYVFGGSGANGPLGDLWAFDLGKQRWEQIEVSDGPSPRYGHAIEVAPDQQSMFVVGGYNKVKHFDDIYQFHFADRKWTQWQVAGSAPGGSCYQSISFVDGRNLISFGGRDVNSDSYNDVKTVRLVELNRSVESVDLDDICAMVPDEVLLHLFAYIRDPVSLCHIACVDRRWNTLADEPALWEPIALELCPDYFKWQNMDHIRKATPEKFKEVVRELAMLNRQRKETQKELSKALKGFTEITPNMRKWTPNKGNNWPANSMKIVAVGDGATGKTCTFIRYANGEFPRDYVPTVFDNYEHIVKLGDANYSIGLWDTAGPEEYDRLRPLSYVNTDMFLLVFSMVSPDSLSHVETKWFPELQHHQPGVPIMLAGSKVDLLEDPKSVAQLHQYGEQPVSVAQAQEMAKKIGAVGFLPYSSLTGQNVELLFNIMIRSVITGGIPRKDGKKRCTIT